ncbi:MAG TPA: GNAT family N-acetyltransferase [Firmicutes bacterium]|jgi:predicted GNAT family acetyltransferase|nr:GNAT family N-acetyltransferase [Bacillota bacterium]
MFTVLGILADDHIVAFSSMAADGEVALVYTCPAFRRRGYGQRVLSEAARYVTTEGRLAYYSVSDENKASLTTALSVGYVEHALQFGYAVAEKSQHATGS